MMGQPRFVLAVAALLLTALANAVKITKNGFRMGKFAVGADDSVWRQAIASANATGSVQVPGYNWSSPYPGSPMDDWTLSISVTADVPSHKHVDKFFTGTAIRWSTPDSLVKNGSVVRDKSWQRCLDVFSGHNFGSDKQEISPTCDGLLPDSCLQVLRRWAENSASCNLAAWDELPKSCRDVVDPGPPDFERLPSNFRKRSNSLTASADVVHLDIQLTPDQGKSIQATKLLSITTTASRVTTKETLRPTMLLSVRYGLS